MKAIILITLIGSTFFINDDENTMMEKALEETYKAPSIADKAFQILVNKCNVCHKFWNPNVLFTQGNISDFAPKIHEQVFIKKRMPMGKKRRLTQTEYSTLEQWLLTLKIK
ncbi:MAG: hypothetical protein JKX73_08495 [Flavobacteriales bacterium]|nr:hypothetical protein [Flavobacteriales bacterium]